MSDCVFCNREFLRGAAEVYLENEHCVYASTRDPRDPPDVLPGCGVIVPIEHRASPFDFTPELWAATHELLLGAKAAWDERLEPDGYTLIWNCAAAGGQETPHAHLHVIPRFDDEPLSRRRTLRDQGAREPPSRSLRSRERTGAPARPALATGPSGPCRP